MVVTETPNSPNCLCFELGNGSKYKTMEKNNRNKRVEIAEKTLRVIESGFYESKNTVVNVAKSIENCVNHTFTVSPDEWPAVLQEAQKIRKESTIKTAIKMLNDTTIAAFSQAEVGSKIGILNFMTIRNLDYYEIMFNFGKIKTL
jgi:hypothetical protein